MNIESLPYHLNSVVMALVAAGRPARETAQTRMPYVYLLPRLILTFVFAGFGFTLSATVAAAPA